MNGSATTRRIWLMPTAGALTRLRLADEQLGAPGPGEVQVRVGAAGLNFADVFACLGLYSATPRGAFVPGLEFAGTVVDAGEGVGSLAAGDRVMGCTRFGGYATDLNIDAAYLQPLPAGWSFAQGAAFPAQALTAWYALVELGRAARGEAALLHSAAGGVGLLTLAMMAKLGVRVVATVGRAEKVEFLTRHAGLCEEQVIVRAPGNFPAKLDLSLRHLNAEGLDLILDSVAGPYFHPGYRRLRPGGRLVVYGAASFMPSGARPNWLGLAWRYLRRPRLDPVQMISENRSVLGFNLIWLWDRAAQFQRMFAQIREMDLDPPHVGARFGFEEAPAALRLLQSGASVGKVVLEV